MKIKEILNYDNNEAKVIVTDGQYELLCYAHPIENSLKKEFYLSTFMAENIMRALTNDYIIEKRDDGYFAYWLQGKLIDLQKKLVAIGNIILELDGHIPKDIKQDEFIEFNAIRIDFSQF